MSDLSTANQVVEAEPSSVDENLREQSSQGVEPATDTPKAHNTVHNYRSGRAYKEGYKDGLCGVDEPTNIIPPKMRQYWLMGYSVGVHDREEQVA